MSSTRKVLVVFGVILATLVIAITAPAANVTL